MGLGQSTGSKFVPHEHSLSLRSDQNKIDSQSTGSKFVPHEHSLILRSDHNNINEEANCELCEKSVAVPFYACDSCEYHIHKSCNDLPLEINHSFHRSHPLHLFSGVSAWCHSCYKDFEDSPFYKCEECNFKMDIECATMPSEAPSKEGQKSLQHFSHPHSLLLIEASDHDKDVDCFACDSKLSGGLAYRCAHCNYFLHKSCAEFPRGLLSRHPLHPDHGHLSLVSSTASITCSVCETTKYNWYNFSFKCQQCDFWLCWCCNRVTGRVEFEDHEHALCFVEKTGDTSLGQCNGNDAYCRQPHIFDNSEEFKWTKLSIFRCLDCNFKLHLLCGPLPSTIKHECHIHALTLLDSLVEDDSGEYYCDVCETERDPRIRVYYCKECKYCAHVHCVISEIVNVLRGDLRGVELMALGKDTWTQEKEDHQSTTMTLKDLIDQIVDEEEKKELERHYKWDIKWSYKDKAEKPPMEKRRYLEEEISEILKLSSFTSSKFLKYCSELQNHYKDKRLELTGSDLGLKTVKVKGYMIPHSLAGVLETLLNEYGDHIIGRKSSSVEMKSFVLFILCRVVKRMRATLIQDITKYLLREWFFHLRFVKNQGFEIGFALAQAESLVDVFLALQAERLEDEVPTQLKKKIDKVERKMDKLRQEMAGLNQDLDKCKGFRSSMSQKSEYMKYCLKMASKFRWYNAFDRRVVGESSSVRCEKWKW